MVCTGQPLWFGAPLGSDCPDCLSIEHFLANNEEYY